MRLSTILELLLIFLLIAFAAYGRVIEPNIYAVDTKFSSIKNSTSTSLKQATENINKHCICNENVCNCCRDFHIPLVQLSGPGCASLQYFQDDKLAMQLSIGDNILSSNIINGKNPKPVCVALPGGFSKFCGKIYSIKRDADKHFKACLGLELRSASELEASLRVSCFRFGPDGLKLRPAEPLPTSITEIASDDDYDDIFDLGDDEDDEVDDDYEKVSPDNNIVSVSSINEEKDQEQEEDDDDDLLGFGALFDIFSGDDDSAVDKKTKVSSTPFPTSFIIPILTLTSTSAHTINESTVSKSPVSTLVTIEPAISSMVTSSPRPLAVSMSNFDYKRNSSEINSTDDPSIDTTYYPLEEITKAMTDKVYESTTSIIDIGITELNNVPIKNDSNNADTIQIKKIKIANKKKINVTAETIDSINNDVIKTQEIQSINNNDELYNEYDYDTSQDDDENDEFEDSNEKIIHGEQDAKDESDENEKKVDSSEVSIVDGVDYEEDEDSDAEIEDDDNEEAMIGTFINPESNKNSNHTKKYKKTTKKPTTNKTADLQEYDADYSYGLTELLARKQHHHRNNNKRKFERKIVRQSKVMRF